MLRVIVDRVIKFINTHTYFHSLLIVNYNIIINATWYMGHIIVHLPKEWYHKNITPSASGESWLVDKVGGNVLYAPTDTFKRVLRRDKTLQCNAKEAKQCVFEINNHDLRKTKTFVIQLSVLK